MVEASAINQYNNQWLLELHRLLGIRRETK